MTRVVHCKHEAFDVYIGRKFQDMPGSIWGNPYIIGRDGTREEVIEKYREYILSKHELLAQLETLRGKTLGCWCKPEKCHGDVLVELLNERQPQNSLGKCCKCQKEEATLKSPSGSVYCHKCGHCSRCNTGIDKFVKYPHGDFYVCICVASYASQARFLEETKREAKQAKQAKQVTFGF